MSLVRHHVRFPLIAAVVLAAFSIPSVAAPVRAADNAEFVSMTNRHRDATGVQPIAPHAVLESIAVERSRAMAQADDMEHDLDLVGRRLTASGLCWRAMAEIIAANGTGSVTRFGEQWMASTMGHREIMLGARYTHAGGSHAQAAGGRYYAAMIFVELCGAGDAVPASPASGFTDIGASSFRAEIGWLVDSEVTAGCSASRFCPRSAVTREQMASFLRRVTGIPARANGIFTDVASSMHRADINGIAAANVAAGCSEGRYCPTVAVTRGQMASFLARALDLPAVTRDRFSDDDGTTHEGAINALAAAGITGGCATGRFCPNAPVTREQMAGFLHRAFAK